MSEFYVVDVFSSARYRGNPVMIVVADEDLAMGQMQAFAAWNGMPETVYLRPNIPAATDDRSGYAARIFSPRAELVFAGHPSLGAAHLAVETGMVQRPSFMACDDGFGDGPGEAATVWQQCAVGEVELKVLRLSAGDVKAFVKTPAPGAVVPVTSDEARAVAAAIGLADAADSYRVSAGANWIVVKLDEPASLAMLKPNMPAIEALSVTLGVSGITVYAPAVDDADVRFDVRSFGPAIGVPEDAVCGGGNACVATLQHHLQGLRVDARHLTYQTRQGRFVGRDGRVHIRGPVEDHRFWIGGTTRTMMTGKVNL